MTKRDIEELAEVLSKGLGPGLEGMAKAVKALVAENTSLRARLDAVEAMLTEPKAQGS